MSLAQRPHLPWCGASCHNQQELARAAELGLDYALLSPVQPTDSHPGAPTLGWDAFAKLIEDYSLPVYALGGLAPGDMETAWHHGAHGICMLRGAWQKA
jgi:8-oxo-dGTP diphosphatase